jgi:hypothetical protein
MQYIIGFFLIIIIFLVILAVALWILNFLLIAIKWIALIGVLALIIFSFVKLVKTEKGKKLKAFSYYLGLAMVSFILFALSDHFQPKLHSYLTSDSNEVQKETEKASEEVVATVNTQKKDSIEEEKNKAETEAVKKGEEAVKRKAELEAAKKKAELEAKKKAELEAKRRVEEEAKKPISTDFSSFDNPYDNMTDLQKDNYWDGVKGKYVQWSGQVVEVSEDTINVKCESETFTYDFGAEITEEQHDSLININIGDNITIYGQLSLKEGVIMSWYLNNAKIVK